MTARTLLLSVSTFALACGTAPSMGEGAQAVSSGLASDGPDCTKERDVYDAAYSALWDCTTRQLEDATVSCRAEVIALQIALWNHAYCKAGQARRITCACEIPEVARDGGRMFQCSGADGGCVKVDAGTPVSRAPVDR